MPTFRVTDPQSGRVIKLTGDSPPTEVELEEIFSSINQSEVQNVIPSDTVDTIDGSVGKPSDELGPLDTARAAVVEPLATIVTGAIAEPIAGLAGIAQAVNPFAEEGAGAKAVEATRKALTFIPKTEPGQKALQAAGEFIAPVGEAFQKAEQFLGNKTFELTGSPALAAAATSLPTLATEILGIATAKGGIKSAQALKRSAREGKITREIVDAVPSVDQLKDASRAVYKEIDDLGVSLKPGAYNSLVNKLRVVTDKLGIDPDITGSSSKAMKRFAARKGDTVSLTEVDTLRTIAQNAAKSIEPADAGIGIAMIDTVDNFLDKVGSGAFIKPDGPVTGIGRRYKTARDLWGRARRSELLGEAFEKARNQASGFENGVRTQFRSIINNKRQRKFFRPDELEAMTKVVRGTKTENFAKLIGRLGFSEGGATNILGGAAGVAGGAAIGGPAGAVIVPLVGQVSRKLAQRMTAKNAEFADQVIRAGKNARKITDAYLRNTKKASRSSQELSELLMRQDIDLNQIQRSAFALEAADIAIKNRAALAGALTVGSNTQEQEAK